MSYVHMVKSYKIYFGDSSTHISPNQYVNISQGKDILRLLPFALLKKSMKLDNLLFLNQVHGTLGLVITSSEQVQKIRPFAQNGDFIITSVKNLGIGIMTADCLPIIFVDEKKHVVAVAHAGWKGSLNLIAKKVTDYMQKMFYTDIKDLKIFFGPSARSCCYMVNESFLENYQEIKFVERVFFYRSDNVYFDLTKFNKLLLLELGVQEKNISSQYNICTICNDIFCSYRRQQESSGRQMTLVSLTDKL